MSRQMMNRAGKHRLAAGLVLLLSTCWGCGTGGYERRLNTRVQQLGQESWLRQMNEAPLPADTPILVRVPKSFEAPPLVAGAEVDGKPVDPRRIKPPSPELFGLKLTYEGFIVDGAGGKMPYYCHLAALNAVTSQVKDPSRAMQGQLHAAFPDGATQWQPVECKTPEGRASQWEKMRVVGQQEFYYRDKDGKESFLPMEGLIELYVARYGDFLVTIGWRMPTSIEPNVGLPEWAPRVAGAVALKEPGGN